MEWKDVPRRGYYEKYERVKVKNDCGWFEVYRLPGDVYAIAEPQHFQEVNMYLIMGSEGALLFDTGMGIFPIKPLVDELYGGAVTVVNSHFHFDHIGNNHVFEPVYNHSDEFVKRIAARGLRREDMGNQLDEDMFKYGYPEGFDPDQFKIPPFTYRNVEEGHEFNLGNRKLEVLYTPGHSDDSIMLYDKENQILFSGDTFYMGALYAHFNCDQFGHSDVRRYYETMKRLDCTVAKDAKVYCSHNDFIVDQSKLGEAAVILKSIAEERTEKKGGVGKGHLYLEEGGKLEEYMGDGFSVVYSREESFK